MMCNLYFIRYKVYNYKYAHIVKPNVLRLNNFFFSWTIFMCAWATFTNHFHVRAISMDHFMCGLYSRTIFMCGPYSWTISCVGHIHEPFSCVGHIHGPFSCVGHIHGWILPSIFFNVHPLPNVYAYRLLHVHVKSYMLLLDTLYTCTWSHTCNGAPIVHTHAKSYMPYYTYSTIESK